MLDLDFIGVIGLFMVAAAIVAGVARVARMPSIVAYIVAGLLLGPVFGVVDTVDSHAGLETVGELGIVLLLFIVGLELSLDRIKQVGKVAVAAGLGQVIFTAAFGFIICIVLGFTTMESVFLATALTFSSTVVVVKLLDQKGDMQSLYGRIAVGIFLVQDLVVVVVLTVVAGLGGSASLDAASIAQGLGLAFVGMSGMLVFAGVAAKYLLPRPLEWASQRSSTLLVWSFAWCLLFVEAAHLLKLSAEIGAFLAGLSIAQLRCAHDLRRRVHPLMTFFVAIFFVALGAGMQLSDAVDNWTTALPLTLFVLIGNPLIFMLIITRYGYSEQTAFSTSVTVAQISEFSFIFAAMGVGLGLIGPEILSIVGMVGLATIAVSSYMILYSEPLYRLMQRTGILRVFRAGQTPEEEPASDLSDHVVVVGMNELGRRIATTLHEAGELVVAVDSDGRKLSDLPCRTVVGDIQYSDTLAEAHLTDAGLAVCALRIEAAAKLFAFRCGQLGVPSAIYAPERAFLEELALIEPTTVFESKAGAGARIVELLRQAEDSPC